MSAQHESRIRRLAGVLGVDWLPGTWVDKYDGRWWLVGSTGDDQPLPNTAGCRTLPEGPGCSRSVVCSADRHAGMLRLSSQAFEGKYGQ